MNNKLETVIGNDCVEITIDNLVEWFLHKEKMSHKKIQKLSYYAQAWSLTLNGKDIIPGIKFEAWVHGPVSPEIWEMCKKFGWRDIMVKEDEVENSLKQISVGFSSDDVRVLELVWDTYGKYDADELEALTHVEDPWKNARVGLSVFDNSNREISREAMIMYYTNQFSYE